ncbi:pentatricopeptide repeat-containing protein At3g26782, mitochondrial-like [Telopea speciosissima]|uniref:pentatricopeptide repeat-containing protein At3g26782, mitochondrial-like n=1 Tax=Telopea speciosissima TaxID=54955 RepID=UPI001CC3905F|nr:pentatricopeptide repeat-containing protein At3g26782, mitochondrial-like [Telopea speciosissima]
MITSLVLRRFLNLNNVEKLSSEYFHRSMGMQRSTTKLDSFDRSHFVEVDGQSLPLSREPRRPVESDTCISVIKQCETLKALNSVHASMLRTHLHLNLFFFTNLICRYASVGYVAHSYALFSACEAPDVFLWNIMIQGFAENGPCHSSVVFYRHMRDLGVLPDNFTFPFALKACAQLRDLESGKALHGDIVKFGYDSDVFVTNSLVAMYGKCELPHVSQELFDRMRARNVVSWSCLLGSYVQNGFYEEGLSLFSRMLDEGIRPNRATILNVIPSVHREDDARGIFEVIVDCGLDLDQSVQNAVVGMYSKCGRIDIAKRFFDVILDKDLLSWSSMIEAYVRADLPIYALELFKEMVLLGTRPDSVTLLSVVRACSNLASLHQARFVHGLVIRRSFFKHEIVLETALIDLYVKCGSLDYARRIFDRLQGRNLISWSIMISGYGMHGQGIEALHLFHQMMKDSVKPDLVTFVSVLSACSHAGLIDEGWRCFYSMTKDFGVVPTSEHYACMVDLLGRAGQLNEALEFIEVMPIKPDSGVWGSLLGACRIHSNVELAELAARYLFELDVDNSGRYVLLSNIYTSSGKREEADRIRSLMRYRRVRKIAGHTIVEVKNKTYKFVTGDQSNPQTDLIYEELEKLMERIRQEGYEPDTNFVLHDVEEETKETLLYSHSEKLAIVFGLLNSVPETVIRIKKNLRICGDCHTATKFISKVTQREIVARDTHRFHHFKGGACSCGDYW